MPSYIGRITRATNSALSYRVEVQNVENKSTITRETKDNFLELSLDAGKWRLRVTNPSGLTTESEVFEVAPPPAVTIEAAPSANDAHYRSFAISTGGSLLFRPYDGALLDLNNVTYFKQELIPDITAEVQFLPFSAMNGRDHWGFSLSFLGTKLFYRIDAYKETTMLATLNAQAVYHRNLWRQKLFAAFKLGVGVSLIKSDFSYNDDSGVNIDIDYDRSARPSQNFSRSAESETSSVASAKQENTTNFYPCASASLSLVWMPFTRFSLEAGAAFTHIFASGMPTGLITPFFVLGVRF